MKLVYPAILKPFSDNSGGYVVEFPDLPGCVTEGINLQEALEMANDAACGWILGELEDGEKIPEASNFNEVYVKGYITSMMILDIDAYAEKYGEKAIRKNLTIPAWLNAYAEKNNINYSKVLQDALLNMARKNENTIEIQGKTILA